MADVFVSYKREDEPRVAQIVAALARAGLDVWWDREIVGGASWRQTINEKLDAAKCVIVVWSEASVSPAGEFVHDEAGRAKRRGVLLPLCIDRVDAPIGFGETQTLNLVGWKGNDRDPRFADVRDAVQAIVAGGPRPTPKALGKRLQLWAAATAACGIAAAVVGFVGDLAGLQNSLCRVPGVRGVCSHFALGGVATPAEQASWDARTPGDCAALRAHLSRFPNGALADEAARRLQASDTAIDPHWRRQERTVALAVPLGEPHFRTLDAAKSDALRRAAEEAAIACAPYGQLEQYRLAGASAVVRTWNCTALGDAASWTCGFRGDANCHIEVRVLHEICP